MAEWDELTVFIELEVKLDKGPLQLPPLAATAAAAATA
jgi:hypothetical protein